MAKGKHQKKRKVLKVKRVPPALLRAAPPLPIPVRELVAAIEAKEIEAIVFVDPAPSRWKRFKDWFSGE